jgi:hypothetical protein
MCATSKVLHLQDVILGSPILFLVFVAFMSDFSVGDKFLITQPFYSGSHIVTLHQVDENLVLRKEEFNKPAGRERKTTFAHTLYHYAVPVPFLQYIIICIQYIQAFALNHK